LVDHVVEVDKSNRQERKKTEQRLLATRWDWIVSPHESLRTQLLVLRLQATRKTGYWAWFNGGIFTERIRRPMQLPEAIRQLFLLKESDAELEVLLYGYQRAYLNGDAVESGRRDSTEISRVPDWSSMQLPSFFKIHQSRLELGNEGLSAKSAELAVRHQLLGPRQSPVVFLAPGSVWPTKRWTLSGYIDCARRITSEGGRVFLFGDQSEKAIAEAICEKVPQSVILAGQTNLTESCELLALADLLICNDSGAMHMAALSGVPTIAVFGPTTLQLGYRPWQDSARVVQKDLSCRPCGKHGSQRCPIGTHACMKEVTPEMVLAQRSF